MEKKYYSARKIKPTNRDGWVIEFRHPLLKDPRGKIGRKIRRGLGTPNEIEAEALVQQMNALLSDESYWDPSARNLAKEVFPEGIVNAFYDEVEYIVQDYKLRREEVLPLKTPKDDFSRVLLLGPTAAGKTTLLRQIMGTDPIQERFPATSTAKTTVFDTEIILSEGRYKAVVTFYTESETRELIKESIKSAMKKFFATNNEKDLQRIFLEDEEQRFRLSYVLGKIKDQKKFSKYENTESIEELFLTDIRVTESEQVQFEKKIKAYIDQIKKMSENIVFKCKKEYVTNSKLTDEDQLLLEEIIISEIFDYDEEDLSSLTDDIVEEIKIRFSILSPSETVTEKFGWPIYWYKETSDRNDFLKSIRYFSSNLSSMFGKLLTPLVSGLRVQGPFKPQFLPNIPKLVIIDGEGLGHTPDTTSNLPSKIISSLDSIDGIILVDDAQSPMLASPYTVIKSTAISGHYRKLFLCFTHFDSVKGDNLPTIQDKIDHIYGSVDNLLAKLESELGYEVKKFLVNHFTDATYYLSNLDEKFSDESKYSFTKDQLIDLINKLENIILPVPVSDVYPKYDISTILFKIQNAAKRFHNIWEGYLYGSSSIPGIKKAHFTQLKALSRRLGYGWENEYSYLRPISDFWTSFNEQISNFLSTPVSWRPSNPSDEDKARKIDEIKKNVSSQIQSFAISHIKSKMISEWQIAYDFSGRGSSLQRADKIDSIYYKVIPIPEEEMTDQIKLFVSNILSIIKSEIKKCGGDFTSIFNE
jgi:hypothetical protein